MWGLNILYIPILIQITRVTRYYDYHSLYTACKKVCAFIIDTVKPNNDDSNQPIEVWDYENVGFDLFYSIIQYRQLRIRGKFPDMLITIFGTKSTSLAPFLFFLYNYELLQIKQYFNLSLDFFSIALYF